MNYLMDILGGSTGETVSPFPTDASLSSVATDGKTPPKEDAKQAAGQAVADLILNNVKEGKPYKLAESGVKAGNDPANTCIGSLCHAYKSLGIDFSALGNEKAGVREANDGGKVVEYNPTFEKNYKKAGFELVGGKSASAQDLYQMIKNQKLQAGDILQYYDEKGNPYHSNMIVGKNEDGSYKMYNGYTHSNTKDNPIYNTNAEEFEKDPEAFKNLKFNVFRVGEKGAKKILETANKKSSK